MSHLHPYVPLGGNTIRAYECNGVLTPCPNGRDHRHCSEFSVEAPCDWKYERVGTGELAYSVLRGKWVRHE